MRRAVLGLMMLPVALVGGASLSRGGREAVASPVENRADARLARMLQGDFEAPPMGEGERAVGAITRKVCRVDAPTLGDQVVYAEERFTEGTGRPISQRVYVVEGPGGRHARIREYTLLDPGGARGLCNTPVRSLSRDEVEERAGCEVDLAWHEDHFAGITAGETCRSILNGATHAKRGVVVREGALTVHEQGYDAQGIAMWGNNTAPIRYERKLP